MKMRII